MMFHRPHHQRIFQVLQKFNATYLAEHSILFGGGTRIALKIEEYRESIDIDFFAPHLKLIVLLENTLVTEVLELF